MPGGQTSLSPDVLIASRRVVNSRKRSLQDPFSQSDRPSKRGNRLLRLDSWIDSTIWSAFSRFFQSWEEANIFFRRFRVRGYKKALFEVMGETMTLGTAGAVLMLALALPAFEEIHTDWRSRDEFSVTFLDRSGNEIGHRGIMHEDSLPIAEMPDHLIKAVLATEDRRFFEHFGIDFIGLVRAMTENVRANSVVQGGSTISQQLAKNLFLSNERTIERKIKEAFLALWLEANYSKNEILRMYFDRAYMGGGTFGIAAAAQFYFGKELTDVTLAESAMLAGLFKAPARYAPHINLPAARARANEVLTNLVQGGMMNEGQVIGARRDPANVVDRGDIDSPDYFLDWAFEETRRLAQTFDEHSLVVRTTVDMSLQQAAEEALEHSLRQHGEKYGVDQGAIVLIEHGGAVRAMVGGRDYGESQFNRATQAMRQPGSSFKVYVYATALENGFTPETSVRDAPITWNRWSPGNYTGRFSGRMTLTRALVKSINTIPVRLTRDHLGTDAVADTAKRMGIRSPLRTDKTIPLGTSEVTVLDQATAYASLPTGGMDSNRHGISQIISYSGDVLYNHDRDAAQSERVLSEQAAAAMNQIMVQIPEWGTGRRAKLDDIVTAGKTGTTQSYRDGWFVGYTGNYTAAVWFGNDSYRPSKRMTGGSLPAMTFKELMTFAHHGVDLRSIPGVEQPDVDDEEEPRAVAAPMLDETGAPIVRARMLSSQATRLLRDLVDQFREAPAIRQQPITPAQSAQLRPTASD